MALTTPPAVPRNESNEERYARQTRNAAVFIAWVIGIGIAVMVIIGIIAGVQLAKVQNDLSGGGGGGSNCMSVGGSNPNC